MQVITEQQSRVLHELSRYKFLTASQFHRLGVGEITGLREKIKALIEIRKPLLGRINFGVHPKKGRLEYVYYLTPYGQNILIEDFGLEKEKIKMPVGNSTLFYKDYTHRKNTIDYQISLYLWAEKQGFEVVFFDTYFDKIGNNRRDKNSQAKNKIFIGEDLYMIPDGIYFLQDSSEKQLHLFEMYDGKDTKRVMQQLEKHGLAYELGSPSTKYDISKAHRTILVFEFDSIKQAVIKRAKEDEYFADISRFFRLNSLEQTKDNLADNWVTLRGEKISFL
jgi:hypothetical protein